LNDFFVDSWEAEEEPPAPQGDATVAEAVRQVHQTISHHTVVDRDEDWGDVDISLPARAVPLVRDESNKIIRDFLLIALRDGIVLKDDLIDACLNTDGSRNEEAERLLSFVVGELGATVVEWTDSEEHFQTEPSMEEELLLAEAMEFAEELALGGNEPFRFYAKDIRGDLLEAEEEKALRQEMEEAGQTALSALATWPEGLSILFAAADRVAAGEADAESFSSGPEPPQNDETVTQLPSADTDTDDGDDEIELKKEASLFINAVEAVKTAQGNAQSMTEALERVQLTRGFLMDLANKAIQDQAGSDFAEAVHRQSAARERMILSNLRLALSIAKKYSWSNLALDDLIQEANIGLMKAVERYDWRKGFRFSTYATWWIRQQVARAIADKSRIVRVPVHAHDAAWKVCQERNQIETRLGRPETEAETAQRIGRSPTEIRKFISMFEEVISLDGTDPDTVLSRADGLADTEEIDPARIVNKESLHSALFGMFAILDERSQEVLRMRFGIGMDTDYTLEEVGQYFDVTRERIRQIQEKALKKLRHPSRLDKLRWFLE
jgi:RNA polymerase primary sigma factor